MHSPSRTDRPDPGLAEGTGIEGRGEAQAATGAVEGHFLPFRHAHGDEHREGEAGEFRLDAGGDVDPVLPVDAGAEAGGLLPGGEARGADRVDADIGRRAAAGFSAGCGCCAASGLS